MKQKPGRPAKKQKKEPTYIPAEEVIAEPEVPVQEQEDTVEIDPKVYCECGGEVVPGTHQCWACAHRP